MNNNENIVNDVSSAKIVTFKEPTYVGYYMITGKLNNRSSIKFLFTKKPNIIHRLFNRILLGWVWEDIKS